MNADFVWQEGLWENRDAGWLTPRLVERLATGMADPRPIPKVMMIALRRDRRMRKAKSGEIDGTDVCILFSKPGREPYYMCFVTDAQGRAVVDVYYSDYARSRKMVHDGTGTLT